MLLELKSKAVEVKADDGTVKHYTNFYLVTQDGSYVAIKPSFKNDYKVLVVLANKEK